VSAQTHVPAALTPGEETPGIIHYIQQSANFENKFRRIIKLVFVSVVDILLVRIETLRNVLIKGKTKINEEK
jgi:hypothetical protein